MGWVEALRGQVVGLDTAPIIYLIEEHPTYLPTLRPFFEASDRGELRVITSTVTLLEVLVHPFRRGDAGLAQQYRDILPNSNGLTCVALKRDSRGGRPPAFPTQPSDADAIQMATAIHMGASFFFTNDARLPSLPTLRMLVLDQLTSEEPTP